MTRSKDQIVGLFPELLGIGGVQEAGRQTAAALSHIASQRGWEARFISLNDPWGQHALLIDEVRVPFFGFNRAKIRFVLSSITQSKKTSRVLLSGHPHLAPAARWAKILHPVIRTVTVSHGIEVWQPLASARRRALVECDIVLAPSSFTALKLSEVQGVAQNKIRRLPWPIDTQFLKMADDPDSLPPLAGFSPALSLLTVGRWAASERYKGTDKLIHAVAQLLPSYPGLTLVAIGGGDDLPRLRQIACDLGISDSVQFVEGLSKQQLASCYKQADVFALPSTGEGFGLVFLEAMAFAKPVVGVSAGGATDLIRDGVNGILVAPNNAEQLFRALDGLLGQTKSRDKLGRKGAEIVRTEYTVEIFQRALGRIIEELI